MPDFQSAISNPKLKISNFPKQPGVYQFLNKDGEVIYVGKAKNLRARVKQYFGKSDERPQIPYLLAEATDVTYTVVNNELESLYLENTLIKQYHPKYNILLMDDKNYAFIKIDYSSEIPQIGYARKIESRSEYNELHPNTPKRQPSDISNGILGIKSRYFGPYTAAYKIRNTLNLIRRIFPYCSAQKVSSRPCFYYYMHRCPGVCVGKITLDDYRRHMEKIVKFLQGDIAAVVKEIKTEMFKAARAKKFETAARLRDQLRTLSLLEEKQNVILPKKVDWDIVSLFSDNGFACINLFKIRGGKLFDKENFVYEMPTKPQKKDTTNDYKTQIMQHFLQQYYLEASSLPKEIFIEQPIENALSVAKLLKARAGKNIKISVPQRGKLKNLIRLGQTNAQEYLKNWLNDKAGNLDKINRALNQLKEVLSLPIIPKRIECYDISNTQGTNAVGSMVVFVDGLPAKSQYRKFKIKSKQTPDDFAMMKEMLTRRLARSIPDHKNQNPINKSEVDFNLKSQISNLKLWPLPDLIVIDGGKGQLAVAVETLQTTNYKLLPIIGLAKRIEEIFLPGKSEPIILDHDQPALQLLQRLRDEAHRFGITFHRQLRSKQAIKSALDDIPGIGPKTKKLLKAKLGTVAEIKKVSQEQLSRLVGKSLAEKIKQAL